MSTWDNTDPPQSQDNPTIQQMRERIRTLETEAKQAEDVREENIRLVRQIAVRDAGLELNDRQRKALEATHEGDWTPELIRQTAADLGFPGVTTVQTPTVPADELAALGRINQASVGGGNVPADAETEIDNQLKALDAEVRSGRMSNERASAEFDRIYRQSGRAMNEH